MMGYYRMHSSLSVNSTFFIMYTINMYICWNMLGQDGMQGEKRFFILITISVQTLTATKSRN